MTSPKSQVAAFLIAGVGAIALPQLFCEPDPGLGHFQQERFIGGIAHALRQAQTFSRPLLTLLIRGHSSSRVLARA